MIWHTPLHGHPQAKLQHYAVNMNSVHVVMYKYMYVETLCYNIKTHRDRHTNAYICTHIDNNLWGACVSTACYNDVCVDIFNSSSNKRYRLFKTLRNKSKSTCATSLTLFCRCSANEVRLTCVERCFDLGWGKIGMQAMIAGLEKEAWLSTSIGEWQCSAQGILTGSTANNVQGMLRTGGWCQILSQCCWIFWWICAGKEGPEALIAGIPS